MSCACGAAAELERGVIDERVGRACMACGRVRVFSSTVEYSDNPHVDPREIVREESVDAEALAWVGAFPRRTRSGDGFIAASARAATVDALDALEREADAAPAKSRGARLRAAGAPGAPPYGHLSPATAPFQLVYDVLSLTPSSPLQSVLMRCAYGDGSGATEICCDIARDALSLRPHVLAEIAQSIAACRPATIAAAIECARDAASAEDIDALKRAIRTKIAHAMPHSSDIGELQRSLAALGD